MSLMARITVSSLGLSSSGDSRYPRYLGPVAACSKSLMLSTSPSTVEIALRCLPSPVCRLLMPLKFLEKFTDMFKDRRVDVAERFELLREAISGTMSSFFMARDRKSGKVVGLK